MWGMSKGCWQWQAHVERRVPEAAVKLSRWAALAEWSGLHTMRCREQAAEKAAGSYQEQVPEI